MARTKRSKIQTPEVPSSHDSVSLAVRPRSQTQSTSASEISPRVSAEQLGKWHARISCRATRKVRQWHRRWGPYTNTNEIIATIRKKHPEEKAAIWLRELTEAIEELSTLGFPHDPNKCATCLKEGSCEISTRCKQMRILRNRNVTNLETLKALKSYTFLDEIRHESVRPSTSSSYNEPSSSILMQPGSIDCNRDDHRSELGKKDTSSEHVNQTPPRRAHKIFLTKRRKGSKVKRSASDVEDLDEEHQDGLDIQIYDAVPATSSSEEMLAQDVPCATTTTRAESVDGDDKTQELAATTSNAKSKKKSAKVSTKSEKSEKSKKSKKSRETTRESTLREGPVECSMLDAANEIDTTSDAEPAQSEARQTAHATRKGKEIRQQQRSGDAAETAIKIEDYSDDHAPGSPSSGHQGPVDGYGSLNRSELLHLVRQLKDEKANQSHKSKVREFLCKHQGATQDMILAFEAKIGAGGTTRKWSDAAFEVFGSGPNAEDSEAPKVKRRRKVQD